MSDKIYVWDRFIRVFHWSLVLLFVTSYLTGENEHWLHIYSGYSIITLLCLRLLWGFVGSRHAKFKNFIYSPNTIVQYTKTLVKGESKQYLGHNPLGGLMVIMLLITLMVTTLSGLQLYAVEEDKGPFSSSLNIPLESVLYADDDEDHKKDGDKEENEEFWEEIHESAVNFMFILIILHILGGLISSRAHDESLLKAMITGFKER